MLRAGIQVQGSGTIGTWLRSAGFSSSVTGVVSQTQERKKKKEKGNPPHPPPPAGGADSGYPCPDPAVPTRNPPTPSFTQVLGDVTAPVMESSYVSCGLLTKHQTIHHRSGAHLVFMRTRMSPRRGGGEEEEERRRGSGDQGRLEPGGDSSTHLCL